jgi:hypothetical protein
VALARRAEAAGAIAAAAERAREIVRAAEAEAAAVVDRARQEATEADTGYAAAWRAATTAGWAPAQLRGMGYPRPVTPRRRAAAPAPAEPVPGARALPRRRRGRLSAKDPGCRGTRHTPGWPRSSARR